MKWRRYIGVDMRGNEIRVAGLRRNWRRGAELLQSRVKKIMPVPISGDSLKEMSQTTEQALVKSLRQVLTPVTQNERRLALSLPDRCGYVMNLKLERFSRSRKEGMEVVMWQVRKLLPAISDLQADYQVLQRSATGSVRVLVVAIEKRLLGLYENLIREAGFIPEYVGFYGLNVYRHWRYRLEPEGDAILVIMNEDGIILQTYRDGVLEYYQARAVGGQDARQVQELHRIVAGGRSQHFSGLGRCRVFLHAEKAVEAATLEALNECFGRKLQILEGDEENPPALTAALGAAECVMMGG
jgi:Tfp pilus assembly PilM family ATPase